MTVIYKTSLRHEVLPTENTCQKSEELGVNIVGREFIEGRIDGNEIRGYVVIEKTEKRVRRIGPVTLNKTDVKLKG